jgi:maleate cis-trans isomerase
MTAPRYIVGTVYPHERVRNPPQVQPLLPPDIQQVTASINIEDYTESGVKNAMQRYWGCVDALVQQKANSVTLAGLPVASQLGRARVLELIQQTAHKTGGFADAHGEAVVAALRHLGAHRIAIASRWSDELNALLVRYLNHAGIEVLAVTSAGQWAQESFSMSIEEGVKLAFQLGREAMQRAPAAQALLLPGGAWRSLAVVPVLEEDYDVPVVTNRLAQTWRLIAAGIAPPVAGWGRLLAHA